MSTEQQPQPAAGLSSNVCSCAELAASNRQLRLRCAQLEEEIASLRELLASSAHAASAHAAISCAHPSSANANSTNESTDKSTTAHANSVRVKINGDVNANSLSTAESANGDEDGELSVEEILRSTAQEMANEAAAAAAVPTLSIEEDLKAAAEEALGSQGYVYDERTGLYYDTNSGYYYDPTEQLFYNSATGVYYTYDSENQSYVFHSRVAASELRQRAELLAVMSGLQHRPPPAGSDSKRSAIREERKSGKRRSSREHDRVKSKKERRRQEGEDRQEQLSDGDSDASRGSKRKAERRRKEKKSKMDKKLKKKTKDRPRRSRRESDAPAEAEEAPAAEDADPYPPCIRMLVLQSPSLPVGSLQIVTHDSGATLGRDPAALPTLLLAGDPSVSKLHCRIEYSRPERQFQAIDMASHTGTLLGGRPISQRREISRPAALWHGCRLQVGGTEFLCHIHRYPGEATCSGCEPGLARPPADSNSTPADAAPAAAALDRRAQLRQLKAKHGLLSSGTAASSGAGYTDRAAARRREVGLDDARRLPGDADQPPAISAAHIDVALHEREASNPGVRLLARMGWRPGDGVGVGVRAERSLREPLGAAPRLAERAGLGSEFDRPAAAGADASLTDADRRRARVAMVTLERYNRITD